MSFKLKTTPPFDRQLKRLAKKYPSLKIEFGSLLDELEINPEQGTPLGRNCFKIRIAISSKGKGKSGGARIVTNILISNATVYLLTIYDKADKDTITNRELDELLKQLPQ